MSFCSIQGIALLFEAAWFLTDMVMAHLHTLSAYYKHEGIIYPILKNVKGPN